jgi:hypothetical protein
MALDPQQFINQARQRGVPDDQINAYMQSHGMGLQQTSQQVPQPNIQTDQVQPSGDIVSNAGNDVKGILNGILGLPGNIFNQEAGYVKEAAQDPNILTSTLKMVASPFRLIGNMAGGVVNEYNQALGQPLQGGDIVGRILNRAYQKPVTTALDVLPFLQAGKAAMGGKTAAEAGAAETAADAAKPGLMESLGNKVLNSQYKLTRSQAGAVDLGNTVSKLADYGITKLDDVRNVVPQVTGDSGALAKIVRDAVAQAKPIETKGITTAAQSLVDSEPLISDVAGKKFYNLVQKGVDTMQTDEIFKGDPSKAFDFVQQLERKAANLRKGNDEAQALAGAYRGVADEIRQRIYTQTDPLVQQSITRERLAEINKISPKLAQEVAQAKSTQDIRSLQAPFVRAGKAVGLTDNVIDNSILTNRDLGAGLVGSLAGGAPGALFTTALEKGIQSNAGKNLLGNVLRGAGGAGDMASQVIKGVTSPVSNQLPLMNYLRLAGQTNNESENSQTNKSNNQSMIPLSNPSIALGNPNVNSGQSGVSTVAPGVKKDQQGNYILQPVNTISNSIPNQPYPPEVQAKDLQRAGGSPYALAQIKAQTDINDKYVSNYIAQHGLDAGQVDFMRQAGVLNDQYNNLRQLVKSSGGSNLLSAVMNDNPQVQYLKSQQDPNYAQMMTALSTLRAQAVKQQGVGRLTQYEVQTLSGLPNANDTKQTALAKIDRLQNILADQYSKWSPMYGLSLNSGGNGSSNPYGDIPGINTSGGQ